MAEVAAASKECGEASEALFGETDEEEKDNIEAAPRRHEHEAVMSAGAAGSEEE